MTLSAANVSVGSKAPVRTHTLTRTDLVRYAGASGDFNPMHHDEVKATGAGQPSVFGHGMLTMAFVGSAVVDYVGLENLKTFSVRFAKQTWPGEVLSTKVVVSGLRTESGVMMVDLTVSVANDAGEVKVTGVASAVVQR
jgi:acyl dehydratase